MKSLYPLGSRRRAVVTDPAQVRACLGRAKQQNGGANRFGNHNVVHRSFCKQGEPFGLNPRELQPYNVVGDADEYWGASAQGAKNEAGSPADEGLSFLVGIDDGGVEVHVPFDVALNTMGGDIVGEEAAGTWPYFKIFSNLDDIPHHWHLGPQAAADSADKDEGPKWESYIIFERFNQRALRRKVQMPIGLYPDVGLDRTMEYLDRQNWGRPGWDARDLSPAMPINPGDALHMWPGIPHAPVGGIAHFELMPRVDNFRMLSGFQDGIVTPRATVCRHMPKGLQPNPGEEPTLDMLRKAAESIDFEIAHDQDFLQRGCRLTPVTDTHNNGNGVPEGSLLQWRLFGKLGGLERYSAKVCTLAPFAKITFSGPALCIWLLDGFVKFGNQMLAHQAMFSQHDDQLSQAIKWKDVDLTVENMAPTAAQFIVVFGQNAHGALMPAFQNDRPSNV